MNSSDVHLKRRLKLDKTLSGTHLCVSLNEAETRKERSSASGGKVDAIQRGKELLLPPRGLHAKHCLFSALLVNASYFIYSYFRNEGMKG